MGERSVGYVLLSLGILVIGFSVFSVFGVFTGRSEPSSLFQFEAVSVDATDLLGGDLTPQEKALAKQQLGESKIELFPAEILNTTTNTLAHLLFMGFVASVGFKISMLGVTLLRPVTVKLREEKISSGT